MNQHSFMMGQTTLQNESATSVVDGSRPVNFAAQDFSFHGKARGITNQGTCKSATSPIHKEQPARPSTPFPENEVQFLSNNSGGSMNTKKSDSHLHSIAMKHDCGPSPADNIMAAPANHEKTFQADCPSQANRRLAYHQQQQHSWPPSDAQFYSGSPPYGNAALHLNPYTSGHDTGQLDLGQSYPSPPSAGAADKEEKVPNSTVRKSRIWKYGRRSSGSHLDRQPFTFSVNSSQQSGDATSSMDSRGYKLFGKRSFSTTSSDDSWSMEPSQKQFISEERMTAEMHNLTLDGIHRPQMFPPAPSHPPASPPTSLSPPLAAPFFSQTVPPHPVRPMPQFHHQERCRIPRTPAEAVLADIESRLHDSDDEAVEEEMAPQHEGQRLEMAPELASALKSSKNNVLPKDIVKKIANTSCMELVLWKPPSPFFDLRGLVSKPPASGASRDSTPASSELTPIMEVEVERERDEAAIAPAPSLYNSTRVVDTMQSDTSFCDEDMDL